MKQCTSRLFFFECLVFICFFYCDIGIFASPDARRRPEGSERKFEATQIFWRTIDTFDTRMEIAEMPLEDRVYLRSGSIIGLREFNDPSTLTFELATGSRFGHVAIAISMADATEVLLRFLERGGIPTFSDKNKQRSFERNILHSDLVVEDLKKAYQPYIDLGEELGWSRQVSPGKEYSFHPLDTKSVYRPLANIVIDAYNAMSPHKGSYSDLLETRRNVQEGFGTFYEPYWDDRALLDDFIFIHFAPNQVFFQSTRPRLFGNSCMQLGLSLSRGDSSVIEPDHDLTVTEVEKLLLFALYLHQAQSKYNYSQSAAGVYRQNCSEFVSCAFEKLGYQVGHKQRMDSLNIDVLNGGIKDIMSIKGVYSPEKIVITPKSVMQTAVPADEAQVLDTQLNQISMHIVPELDRLNVAETISDKEIWSEWEKAGRLSRGFRLLKNLYGIISDPLSEEKHESHSRDGLSKDVASKSKVNKAYVAGGIVGLAVIGTGCLFLLANKNI